jgi:hypothetical protein
MRRIKTHSVLFFLQHSNPLTLLDRSRDFFPPCFGMWRCFVPPALTWLDSRPVLPRILAKHAHGHPVVRTGPQQEVTLQSECL